MYELSSELNSLDRFTVREPASVGEAVTMPAKQDLPVVEDFLAPLMGVDEPHAETVLRFARLGEFCGGPTGAHVERMSQYCGLLAHRLHLAADRCALLRLASQLHDVGNLRMPHAILMKHGQLAPLEYELIKGHAEAGYQMLCKAKSELVRVAASIARTHHERCDGSGYPRNLNKNEIPLEARIAAVADVFDALTTTRPYRAPFAVGEAIEMIGSQRGHHFDPDVVDAFLGSMADVEALRLSY